MSRQKPHIVPQRKQVLTNRADQRGVIATRKVRPADRAPEEHIADDREACRLVEEDDVAGRVPRAVAHLQGELAHLDLIALTEPARRLEGLGGLEREPARLLPERLYPEAVTGMRTLD